MDGGNLNTLKFAFFCKVCEKIRSIKSKQKAGETLQKFIDYAMASNPTTFFPVLRLFLPQLDRERGPYGVKETNLSKTYKRILGLAPNSNESKILSNFSSPSSISCGAMGDFSEVLSCILRNRCGQGEEMTIDDVNTALDNIALKHAEGDPRAVDDVFTEMVNKMSCNEQKWLVKIILKKMDLGLGDKKILSVYHPDANEVYFATNSICKVCEKLKNRNIRYYELGIEIFQSFKPMLCAREDVHTISISSPHYVETKLDGERFQLHYKDRSFRYFSRNGYDYSDNYGETPETGHFTSLIMKQLSPDLQSCILDGELMGWHVARKKFITKSCNIDVKHLRLGSRLQPCFCVFDILLYNDSLLINQPLSERIKLAESVFTPSEGVIMHVNRSVINNNQEALDSLNDAIDNNEEGIIIKDPNSLYIPNSRQSQWRKLKPDYSEGTVDLDLLIIGGYYGRGRKKGIICHFLLGVAEESPGDPEKFMSVARVSSGISDSELDELSNKLAPHWVKYKGVVPPFMLLKREKPDVFINPRNSVILQVKAPEVMRSDAYFTEYTLRFVRVEKIRYDKLWCDCLKINEFTRLRTVAAGKLTAGHILPSSSSRKKRKLETNDRPTVSDIKIEKISDLLSGKEICIMTGDNYFSKEELEKMVRQQGGSVVSYPSSSTFCILYGNENIRVRNVIKSKKHNVAKLSWLLSCIREEKVIPWNRHYLVSSDLKTEATISKQFDAFGDNYFEPLSIESLTSLFDTMATESLCSPEEINKIDELLFSDVSPFSFFRNHYAYVDLNNFSGNTTTISNPFVKNAEIIFRFLGGKVCKNINVLVSHVLMDDCDLDNLSSIKNNCKETGIFCKFVSYRWIIDSFKCKEIQNDDDYNIDRLEPWDIN